MRRMYSEKQLVETTQEILREGNFSVEKPQKSFDVEEGSTGGRTMDVIYNKVVVSGGILYVILNYVAKNETESTIASGNISFDAEVDDETAEKIYCLDGEKLSDPYTSQKQITNILSSKGPYLSSVSSNAISKVAKNRIRIFQTVSSLNAGTEEQQTARQFLTLF